MNLIEIVVAALHQNVRKQLRNQPPRRHVIEDRHVIDNPQSGEYLGTFSLIEHGSIRSLQLAHCPVAIYRHHERVAERARLCQVANMPDV